MELEMKITCTCHQAKISICCQTPTVTPIAPKTCSWGFFNMLNLNFQSDLFYDHSSNTSLSSHFILIFSLFLQLKTVNLHFFTPVISPTLHFFTLQNPNPESSKKTSTPPKMIHPSARGYSHHNHQDSLIQHNI